MDWSKVDERMALEILNQGQKKLEATVQLAIAADQRAATLAGIFSAASVAVFGGTVIELKSDVMHVGFAVGGGFTAVTLFAAAALCGYALRPAELYVPGGDPEKWWRYRERKLVEVIGARTEIVQDYIKTNTELVRRNSRWFMRGLVTGLSAPVVGMLGWLTYRLGSALFLPPL